MVSIRLLTAFCLLPSAFCPLPTAHCPLPTAFSAQVRAPYNEGAAGLGLLLRRLQTTASVMHTGAHPDDEDSALIARLARGDAARVAYLSLNRGEGGQNLIGPELFETLGVIRTEELLQARRLDGGDQLFGRTIDFGFTKTRAEAADKWGERDVLADMVRAIRKYRPLVIISRWSGTPRDGHGQHQLAGYITPLAFRVAADPSQFPRQISEGLRPWQARKLYVSGGRASDSAQGDQPPLRIETGRYDPLLGRSYYALAMEGRSQHKSQEQGALELRGTQTSSVRLLESKIKTDGQEQNIFDGLDISITGIASITELKDDSIKDDLAAIEKAAARALKEYDPFAPQKIIAPLSEGLKRTRQARESLKRSSDNPHARMEADFLLAQKEREFTESLQHAAGLSVDVLAESETVAPGESLNIAMRIFAPGNSLARVEQLRIQAPANWRVEQLTGPSTGGPSSEAREAAASAASFRVTVPDNAPVTQPYWLREPRDGYLFSWPDDAPKSEPFAPALIHGEATVEIDGVPLTIVQPVQYRYADPVRGELRRNLNVVPALSVALNQSLIIAPVAPKATSRRITVRLVNNSQGAISGRLKLLLPNEKLLRQPWHTQPAEAPFVLKAKGERTSVVFNLTIPGRAFDGAYRITALVTTADGKIFDRAQRTVAYPHIQTHRLYSGAETTIHILDLKVAPVRVGYIMGSGDDVPEAIKQMGLQMTLLDENELSAGDLSRFDTIVAGIRASQTRPDFVSNNNRLLDFVRQGGTLIVQYQRPDYAERGLPPFPAKMQAQGTISRVVDENAPVTILQPQHPAFNYPNRITEADWRSWVQERNLYNFVTFDSQYVPLLESHDGGEPPQQGGEVYARLGQGHYVYTSYAWFRQLPAGVPGAYRLFANLLSLSKSQPRNNEARGTPSSKRRHR